MTQQDITRLRVINQTIDAVITIREAAELLSLSERQVIRLKKGVLEQGPTKRHTFLVLPACRWHPINPGPCQSRIAAPLLFFKITV